VDIVEAHPPPDGAIDAIQRIVKICPLPARKPWGPKAAEALIMELMISTLSHALNEDFIVARLRRLQSAEPAMLDPARLANIDQSVLARWFELYDSTQTKRNPQRLAGLIRANFEHFCADDSSFADDLFSADSGSPVSKAREWLAAFPVFEKDPLQKKSALILQRLYLEDYLPRDRYATLPFAVDRHIVRLFLRLRWITVHTGALKSKVAKRLVLSAEEDTALRLKARMVMSDLAERSDIPHPQLNYVLWQFARSYCARRDPACVSVQPTLVGARADFTPDGMSPCLLSDWCWSLHAKSVLDTVDPAHRGDLY